jgi:hypothetical protein|tara:strand:+ start:5189 stop:5536 length:348 start_codon:yes stop_codon:yes gene_type:complete
MPVLAMAVPVPFGKSTVLEQHIAEVSQHPDFDKTLMGFGIENETWHLQATPQGDLLILVFECDDPNAMLRAFADSQEPLPVMQKRFLNETLGMDLSQPPPGPPSRTIFEWKKIGV